MTNIKTPVRNGGDSSILDANGKQIAFSVFGEMDAMITALNRQPEIEAEVAELARYKAMVEHSDFCSIQMWSWSPLAYDKAVEISTDGLGEWRWFDPENDGKLITESPVCDTLLDAVEALAAADTVRGDDDGK